MRSLLVLVKLNEVTTAPKMIPPWELPVLEGATPQVVIDGDHPWTGGELPNAQAEYDRLAVVYGSDAETKVSHVAFAYGVGAVGVKNLAKAIKEAAKWEGNEQPADEAADESEPDESESESEESADDAGEGDADKQDKKKPEKPKNKGGRPRKGA